jgi:hypothetical protein
VQPTSANFFRGNWFAIVLEVFVAVAWTAFLYELFGASNPFQDVVFFLCGPVALAALVISIRNCVLRKRRLWVAILSVVFGIVLCGYIVIEGLVVLAISSI